VLDTPSQTTASLLSPHICATVSSPNIEKVPSMDKDLENVEIYYSWMVISDYLAIKFSFSIDK
jgi:hypothetical protein